MLTPSSHPSYFWEPSGEHECSGRDLWDTALLSPQDQEPLVALPSYRLEKGTHLGSRPTLPEPPTQSQAGGLILSKSLCHPVSGAHKGLQTALTASPTPSDPQISPRSVAEEVGNRGVPPTHVQRPCTLWPRIESQLSVLTDAGTISLEPQEMD